MNAKLDYDVSSDAAYLRFSSNPVLESEEISPGVVIDFDADGKIVAIEFLNARRAFRPKHLPPLPNTNRDRSAARRPGRS